jgi:hypothetical protein
MKRVTLDCPQCEGNIIFDVYDLDDSPSGERFAEFVRHERPEWFCPYRYRELRLEREEFLQLREEALTV